ncbi:MAG: class I SAM-dependent methyltransferase [Caldilineaceae bacterium SB0662_bin_25]|nr:class I SAM-dependent methyltransferase [Caldilineaceae bacterium SB0662_bin_25]
MPFTVDGVVPWGRTMEEYCGMFDLGERELRGRILGCGDGPASFNAEMTALGYSVVSVDPLYAFSAEAIERRVEETYDIIIEQLARNRDDFVWTYVPSIAALGQRRMWAMRNFLDDYARGLSEGRYLDASLPDLPFENNSFDLALSSHFLFLYSQEFDLAFHVRALEEMLRVAPEARAFPLLQVGGAPSPHVQGVIDAFTARDIQARIEEVPYEFQRGGSRMLRLRRSSETQADR